MTFVVSRFRLVFRRVSLFLMKREEQLGQRN